MRIMVLDGQGGGIGTVLIKELRKNLDQDIEILALGTNSIATSQMMKAGANRGATGENAIVLNSTKVDMIIGPLAIIMPNSMMGELTSEMAKAVSSCPAHKVLIPLTQENLTIIGISSEPLPHLVGQAIRIIKEKFNHV